MAKDGKGPPIPISGGKRKRRVRVDGEPQPHGGWLKRNREEPPPELPDILLPDKLSGLNVTSRALQKGTYQRKLLAFFAPVLMPELFNSIRRNLHISDAQTQKLAAEIFGLTASNKAAVNVLVNQTNNNEAKAASVSRSNGPTTPDEMFRMLAEEREQRKLGKDQIEFIATPDKAFEPKQITEGGE